MSANPVILPSTGRQNEPSMEEILASIRRIISDDQPSAKSVPDEQESETLAHDHAEDEDDDILDLAEVSMKMTAPAPSHQSSTLQALEDALGVPKSVMPEPVEKTLPTFSPPPAPPASPPPVSPPPIQSVQQLEERILSQETGTMVNQAMQALSRLPVPPPPPSSGRTIEDVVVEALRPVLRTWLDDHLPGIVERLVKAEIERVTRGG